MDKTSLKLPVGKHENSIRKQPSTPVLQLSLRTFSEISFSRYLTDITGIYETLQDVGQINEAPLIFTNCLFNFSFAKCQEKKLHKKIPPAYF